MLQGTVALFCLVPLCAGAAGMAMGGGFLGLVPDISADSHIRYLSGLLFAIGLGFVSCLPAIEAKTARFRVLTCLVVTGGLARAVSLLADGAPSAGMLSGLGIELAVTPLLCLWQGRIARGKLNG